MRRYLAGMNPTVRGFLVIALIAAVIVVLSLQTTLASLFVLARIAFFIAIAVVVYLVWRDRLRHEIDTWSRRSRLVFYGGAALIVGDLAAYFWPGRTTAGPDALAFLVVLGLAGFAMFRVWRDEHTYSY